MRNFETGATRDSDESKFDYEGFLSPLVLEAYAAYMHKNRKQADGNLRASDNWQKGIPKDAYMKSMFRHFMSVWKGHRNGHVEVDELAALMFNVMGYMFEALRDINRIEAVMREDAWTSADEDKIYTHRYGALAHDQENIDAEEDEDRRNLQNPEQRFYSPLPRKYEYTEQDPAFPGADATVRALSGLEHG